MSILSILLCVLFGLPLLRYIWFYRANIRTGDLHTIRHEFGSNFWPALFTAYLSAVFSELVVILLIPFGRLLRNGEHKGETPVVLVHGLYHNPSAWIFFRVCLARAGYRNFYCYGYNSFTSPFAPAVEGLGQFMDQVLAENPGLQMVLVGHSLGGLVIRKAVADSRFQGRIAALATLGSPHHGSELAMLGIGPMARALQPGREIEQALESTPDPDVPRLSIYSLLDDYVFPLGGLMVGRPEWQEQICGTISHVFMLLSQDVAWRVAGFLDQVDRGE